MSPRLFARLFLAAGLIALAFLMRPNVTTPAQAQGVSVSIEFREALEPHGRWQRHARWGEVWIPRDARDDWRPYTRGNWAYTEEWGWYWNSEEEWGWVAYHYGRWVRDREVGWVWIPGREWAPAWVSWRRGGEDIGWAPLPPEDVIVEIEDDPEVWIFVRSRDVIAPNIFRAMIPRQRTTLLVRETVVVNRTEFVSGARVAANVGVPPSYIARAAGRPIRVSNVQPVVLRGTVGVRGAIEVDAKDSKQPRKAIVKQAERNIQPAKDVPAPQRLRPGETRQDTPDAPNVLRQAQPQQQQTPNTQKQDAPATQNDVTPKADQKKDAAPKADEKQDAAPKSEQPQAKQKTNDAAPKAKQEPRKDRRDDQPKAETKERPKADQPKSEQKAQPEQRMQHKRDLPDRSEQPKRDTPKADQPKRDAPKADTPRGEGPKGNMPKSDAAPKSQPQRKEGPKQQGPGPTQDKKDN